ncbi:hypothetical protein Ddye_027311 [Dipteronia dyeriana]|uniref:Uncharacterized protein n=1 Tax=Dipteronia dyeriana TaxID=168575 RepID=A0AAD9TPI2_9ROSI|nr:hypothetical protein Ddye_027311 [Dipteronia dyeriana]
MVLSFLLLDKSLWFYVLIGDNAAERFLIWHDMNYEDAARSVVVPHFGLQTHYTANLMSGLVEDCVLELISGLNQALPSLQQYGSNWLVKSKVVDCYQLPEAVFLLGFLLLS